MMNGFAGNILQNLVLRLLLHLAIRYTPYSPMHTQGRTQKIFMGEFIQWYMVFICIWCALFVTSQFDIIVIFPNQWFGEVC